MIDFSIIIPVYNAEKTIVRCLNSIQKQSFDNFEVLIMDDGSADKSYDTCLEFQRKDNRFKVFSQMNQGPSAARNRCLDIARGKWVCFVDSDDMIVSNYLDKLNQVIMRENPEVIFFGYSSIDAGGMVREKKVPKVSTSQYYDMLIELSEKDMFGYTWIKSFKRDCIGTIRFCEKLDLFEDEVFTCEVLERCSQVSLLDEALYLYSINVKDALMQKTHQDYCINSEYVFAAWKKLLTSYNHADRMLREKARMFIERCRFYGYERKINVKIFFEQLAETEFFALGISDNKFHKAVMERKFGLIYLERCRYRLKVKIAEVLYGKEKSGHIVAMDEDGRNK